MSIASRQEEIIADFEFFEEWEDKYAYIIDQGKELIPYPEAYRDDAHIVKGCQSQVWLHAEKEGDLIRFYGDSDALIVKGLISLLLKVFSDTAPKDILDSELFFIDRIGLGSHLSPTRSNGLAAMVKQIRMYALAMSSQ